MNTQLNTSTETTIKPNSEAVIKILDAALPKIKAFSNLPYTQANKLLQDDYFIEQWKYKKRAFGSLFLNLDYDNRTLFLKNIGFELSEPKEKLKKLDGDFAYIFEMEAIAKEPFKYKPVEQVIVDKFCLYALNHSRNIGKKSYINVKGWIALYEKMTANEKIEFANMLVFYN